MAEFSVARSRERYAKANGRGYLAVGVAQEFRY